MSDLKALDLMVQRNQDISASTTVVRGNATKRGDEITMGTAAGHLEKMINSKYLFVLYVVNAEQFNAAKKELEDHA